MNTLRIPLVAIALLVAAPLAAPGAEDAERSDGPTPRWVLPPIDSRTLMDLVSPPAGRLPAGYRLASTRVDRTAIRCEYASADRDASIGVILRHPGQADPALRRAGAFALGFADDASAAAPEADALLGALAAHLADRDGAWVEATAFGRPAIRDRLAKAWHRLEVMPRRHEFLVAFAMTLGAVTAVAVAYRRHVRALDRARRPPNPPGPVSAGTSMSQSGAAGPSEPT